MNGALREQTALAECDVFFFEAGGQLFGADPLDITRVDRLREELPVARLRVAGSGRTGRVLVVRQGGAGEVQVPIDKVLGVRRLGRSGLCKVPQYVTLVGGQAAAELLGLLVEEERPPVLLVDLKAVSARAEKPSSEKV